MRHQPKKIYQSIGVLCHETRDGGNASRLKLRRSFDMLRYARHDGLNEGDWKYIIASSLVYGHDCPFEFFRVLKEKELSEFGEYRTMSMVLEAFRKDVR